LERNRTFVTVFPHSYASTAELTASLVLASSQLKTYMFASHFVAGMLSAPQALIPILGFSHVTKSLLTSLKWLIHRRRRAKRLIQPTSCEAAIQHNVT